MTQGIGSTLDGVITRSQQVQQQAMMQLMEVASTATQAQSKPLGRVAPQTSRIDVYA